MKQLKLVVLLGMALCSVPLMAKTLNVVTSFTVLADITKQVGGDHVAVTSLVGPDGDPHTFEPSPQDSVALNKADVVIVNGLGLEGWMDRLIKASGFKGKLVVASTGVNSQSMVDDGETITDPHAWNSAKNGEIYAKNIMQALEQTDPEDASAIKAQGEEYIRQLAEMDAWTKQQFADIPVGKRKVLTSHDAFGYFSKRYDVMFLSPIGYSTEEEASAATVASLIKQIKEQGIKTYFIENQTDPRLVKQIASATGAQPGGELYPEALSPADGPATTYVMAFKHNVKILADSMK